LFSDFAGRDATDHYSAAYGVSWAFLALRAFWHIDPTKIESGDEASSALSSLIFFDSYCMVEYMLKSKSTRRIQPFVMKFFMRHHIDFA
jgi:hypothetical protein